MTKGTDQQGLVRLDEEECWRFLDRHWLGRVGLVHLGEPLVFPVNYAVDGRSIVFRTAPGTKLSLADADGRAVFEVDEASELFETGTSVMVHGAIRHVTDRAVVERLERLPLRTWAPGDRDHFLRVVPEAVSGRMIAPHGVEDGVVADGG
jgi:nitroimidazol reductase NimA-like FMN-containing flavoprotein (pyridoxamine 5'-phosphate oxidase superfamily)